MIEFLEAAGEDYEDSRNYRGWPGPNSNTFVDRLGRALGGAVSWTLLAVIFYTVFLPFGLLFRRGRKDSMKRYYEPTADSYWSQREAPETDPDSYRRQF